MNWPARRTTRPPDPPPRSHCRAPTPSPPLRRHPAASVRSTPRPRPRDHRRDRRAHHRDRHAQALAARRVLLHVCFCVSKYGMSEDMACQRICAARVARRVRRILPALGDGGRHLSGIITMAPDLRGDTPARARASHELLDAAENKTRRAIERLVAERFPKSDVATVIKPLLTPALTVPQTADSSAP